MTKYYVNGDEVLIAIRNWDKVMNNKPSMLHVVPDKGPYRFSTFIGPHELVAAQYQDINSPIAAWGWLVPEPAYKKIKMLASPYHYALLKAFKAKTGWQGVIP